MTKSKQSTTAQEESTRQNGSDPLERLMKRLKVPVTRESYLDLAYLGQPPAELSAEEEADLPKSIQKNR